jgi:hypothetical protein
VVARLANSKAVCSRLILGIGCHEDGTRHFLAAILMTGCHSMALEQSEASSTTSPAEAMQLKHPLLTFEVIPIPGTGVAEEVVGDIKVLLRDEAKRRALLPTKGKTRITIYRVSASSRYPGRVAWICAANKAFQRTLQDSRH